MRASRTGLLASKCKTLIELLAPKEEKEGRREREGERETETREEGRRKTYYHEYKDQISQEHIIPKSVIIAYVHNKINRMFLPCCHLLFYRRIADFYLLMAVTVMCQI